MNKLIRQCLPRNTNAKNVNRPRKKLNYLTPNEVIKSGAEKT